MISKITYRITSTSFCQIKSFGTEFE